MNNQHFYLLSLSLSFHSAEDRILEKRHKLMGNEAAMKTFSLVLLAIANNTNDKRLLKVNYTICMYHVKSMQSKSVFLLVKKNKTWLLLFWTDTLYCIQFLRHLKGFSLFVLQNIGHPCHAPLSWSTKKSH